MKFRTDVGIGRPCLKPFPSAQAPPRDGGGQTHPSTSQQTVDVKFEPDVGLLAGVAAQLVEDLAAALVSVRPLYAGVDRVAVVAVGAAEQVAILAAPLALLDLARSWPLPGRALPRPCRPCPSCRLSSARRWARDASRGSPRRILGFAHVALGAAQRPGIGMPFSSSRFMNCRAAGAGLPCQRAAALRPTDRRPVGCPGCASSADL